MALYQEQLMALYLEQLMALYLEQLKALYLEQLKALTSMLQNSNSNAVQLVEAHPGRHVPNGRYIRRKRLRCVA